MRKSSKLLAGILTLVVMVSMVLAGCGQASTPDESSGTQGETTQNTSNEAPKSDITLSVVMAKGWEKDPMHDLFNKYTEKSGVKFDVQVLPDDKASDIIKTKFATSEFPDIMLNSASTRELTYMLPEKNLTDLSNESWVSKIINKELFEDNGKIYGLPLWSQDYWGLAVNTSVFNKFGIAIPKTKADFINALETLKENNVQPMYLGSKDTWMLGNMTSSGLWAAMEEDPELVNKLTTNQIKYAEIPSFVNLLTDLKEYNDKGYFGANTMADTWDGQFAAFANDKIGVGVGLTSWVAELEAKFPGSADKIEFIPYFIGDNTPVCAGGMGQWYIPNTGKHIDTVKDFFNFATEKEILDSYYTKLEAISPFKDVVYKLPKASQLVSDKISSGDYKTHLAHNSIVQGQDWDGLCKVAQEVLIGTKTPIEAANAYDVMRGKIAKAIGLTGF